jgi:hypothetical protein
LPEQTLEAKEEHIQFGCMPSFNAYGMKGLSIPGREVPFRPAGGHIHFGVGKLSEARAIEMVKGLDAILGVVCVSLFASFDDPRRRSLYGLAGEYRLPPHGLEYRVLSNAWLFHPLIMNLVFDLSRKALVFGDKGFLKFWKTSQEETIKVINSCDVKGARKIMELNKPVLRRVIASSYIGISEKELEVIYNIFYKGMESVVKDPTDIVGNWNLNGTWVAHSDGKDKNWLHGKDTLMAKKKVA